MKRRLDYFLSGVCDPGWFVTQVRLRPRLGQRRAEPGAPGFRHYLTDQEGVVEIESEWTGRKRERMGLVPRARVVSAPVSFGDT